MTLMFDSPLNKKLTESETVIAELVVEDILAWLHEQKLPLYVALNKWHASIASKDARWDVALRFSGTLAHYTNICDSALSPRAKTEKARCCEIATPGLLFGKSLAIL